MFRHEPWYFASNLVIPDHRFPMAVDSVSLLSWWFKNWYAHRGQVLVAYYPGIWREKIAVICLRAFQHLHQMFVKTVCFDTLLGFDAKEVPHYEVQELMDHVGAIGMLPQPSNPLVHSAADCGVSVPSFNNQSPKVVVVEISFDTRDE